MQGLRLLPVAGQGRGARRELRGRERQAAVLTAGPAGLRGLAPFPAGAGTNKLVVDHSL